MVVSSGATPDPGGAVAPCRTSDRHRKYTPKYSRAAENQGFRISLKEFLRLTAKTADHGLFIH
jgi:hypothetical protein